MVWGSHRILWKVVTHRAALCLAVSLYSNHLAPIAVNNCTQVTNEAGIVLYHALVCVAACIIANAVFCCMCILWQRFQLCLQTAHHLAISAQHCYCSAFSPKCCVSLGTCRLRPFWALAPSASGAQCVTIIWTYSRSHERLCILFRCWSILDFGDLFLYCSLIQPGLPSP